MATVAYPHIELDEAGEPVIAGTGTKVIFVAMDRLAHHWDADEIRRQRPHLTLGQIYSALAYYYDHEDELNAVIAERDKVADEIGRRLENPTLKAKLSAAKRAR